MSSRKIAVIGTGYVGLTSGACLASLGHHVVCVDNDEEKLNGILGGSLPIYEPGLVELVADGLQRGRLEFSSDLLGVTAECEFVFMCLPTPPLEDGSADVTILMSVTRVLEGHLAEGTIVVNKSTVPVSSLREIERILGSRNAVVSNPEFLREGSAVVDFLQPDRIVVGADVAEVGERVAQLYSAVDAPVLLTSPESAETIKYMANSFLAAKVSFVNEVARFSHHAGADVRDVLRGLALDPRIGSNFLAPGPGWGGSCFPKDTRALVASAKALGVRMHVVESAIESNRVHLDFITDLVRREVNEVGGRRIAVLGLSFKAMTDDVRESPAVSIVERLLADGMDLAIYDPVASGPAYLEVCRHDLLESALTAADVAVILTEWEEFARMDPRRLAALMSGRSIVDSRYVLDKTEFEEFGFRIVTVG